MVSQMPGSQPGAARPAFHEWGGFDSTAPGEGITSRFAATVRAAGAAVAAVEGSTSVTYDELDRRSNQLARFMLRQGAGPGSLVGLHAGRSLASLLAIVATLKIRAGYVPLDPTTPYAYLDSIVRDCRDDLVFSATRDSGVFAAPAINLADALALARAESNLALEEDAQPDDIAYVMYTSGSTGRPKGVRIPHRAVVRLVTGQSYAHFGADEVVLHNSPLSFDASTFEIWGTLLHGARCVLVTDDPPSLKTIANTIRREGVTTAWFTAGLFRALVDQELEALSGLRQLLAGGDVLSPSHVMRALAALPGCQLINGVRNYAHISTIDIPRNKRRMEQPRNYWAMIEPADHDDLADDLFALRRSRLFRSNFQRSAMNESIERLEVAFFRSTLLGNDTALRDLLGKNSQTVRWISSTSPTPGTAKAQQ